jgi:outer membrane protein OmpA-like peptidoglycan-associated protein
MKFRVLQTVLITVYSGIFLPAIGQKNYYVVVGAFSTEQNVKEFTTHLPSFNPDTTYAMSDADHTLHLYVLRTTDKDVAVSKTMQMQEALENRNEVSALGGSYESVSVSNSVEGKSITVRNSSLNRDEISSSEPADAGESNSGGKSQAAIGGTPAKVKGKLFKFTLSSPEGNLLPDRVHYVDYALEKEYASYETDAYTDMLRPYKNEEMTLVCGVFGYKQVEKFIDYKNPSSIEGAYEDENGAWVIPYELKRLEKGDVSVMYNVAFYKDAVVMLPQSETDLKELLNMMIANPGYEITVHGHCNGKHSRRIIAMGSEQAMFDINGSKEIEGSAKSLSAWRAESVKNYLIQNGIDEKRIKTYAWGGSYMLVDKNSPYAKLNDRIEIEIRKD